MKSGRINSKASIKTAERALARYNGSWEALEKACKRGPNGEYIIPRASHPKC